MGRRGRVVTKICCISMRQGKGEFHNHFITFSYHPKLVEIKGKDLVEKVQYIYG